MKQILSLTIILSLSAFIVGCGSSKQFVVKPDINKPVADSESIIQLKRANNFGGGARSPDVIANDKLIGEIANGDELVWKTKSNSLECISINYGMDLIYSGIILESTPLSYKCFSTKPQEVLSLTYDFTYPKQRAFREIAFVPIFKDIDKPKTSKSISLANVTSNVKTEEGVDLQSSLQEAIKKQFKEKLNNTSTKTIDLEILDYKTGDAASRWFASSHQASTLAKVKVTIKENNVVKDTFITRPVVSSGGFFSVGADTYIFDEVAEDVFLYFFEPRKETEN